MSRKKSNASGSISTSDGSSKFDSKFGSKNFRVYLDELKKACETEIYIKQTHSMDANLRTSSNLQAYILWFNRLSSFVSTEVVKHLRREKRVQLITYFIDVAYHCFEMGNYNSTMAIIGIYLLFISIFLVIFIKVCMLKSRSKFIPHLPPNKNCNLIPFTIIMSRNNKLFFA